MKIRLIAVILALATLAFSVAPPMTPVHAAGESNQATGYGVSIPLNVNCATIPNTQQAHAVLAQYGLCGFGRSRGPQPDYWGAPVTGSCGSLQLGLFDSGQGRMTWIFKVNSTLGPIFSTSYSGFWDNTVEDRMGNMSGGGSFIFSSSWTDVQQPTTGTGFVTGYVTSQSAWLVVGIQCTANGVPTAFTYLS